MSKKAYSKSAVCWQYDSYIHDNNESCSGAEQRVIIWVILDPPQYSPQKEQQSRIFPLVQHIEGSVKKEP